MSFYDFIHKGIISQASHLGKSLIPSLPRIRERAQNNFVVSHIHLNFFAKTTLLYDGFRDTNPSRVTYSYK